MQTQYTPKNYLSKSTVVTPTYSSPSSSPSLTTPSPGIQKRRTIQMNKTLASMYRTVDNSEQSMKKHYQELFWKVKSECLKRNLDEVIKSIDDLRFGLEPIDSKIEILKDIIIKNKLNVDY